MDASVEYGFVKLEPLITNSISYYKQYYKRNYQQ